MTERTTPRTTSVDAPLTGSVHMEFSFDAEVDIKKLTKGWDEKRIAKLAAGDEEVLDDLVYSAIFEATGYEAAEPDHVTVTINGVEREMPR